MDGNRILLCQCVDSQAVQLTPPRKSPILPSSSHLLPPFRERLMHLSFPSDEILPQKNETYTPKIPAQTFSIPAPKKHSRWATYRPGPMSPTPEIRGATANSYLDLRQASHPLLLSIASDPLTPPLTTFAYPDLGFTPCILIFLRRVDLRGPTLAQKRCYSGSAEEMLYGGCVGRGREKIGGSRGGREEVRGGELRALENKTEAFRIGYNQDKVYTYTPSSNTISYFYALSCLVVSNACIYPTSNEIRPRLARSPLSRCLLRGLVPWFSCRHLRSSFSLPCLLCSLYSQLFSPARPSFLCSSWLLAASLPRRLS